MSNFPYKFILLGSLAWPFTASSLELDPNPAPVVRPLKTGYWGIGFDVTNYAVNRSGILANFSTLPASSNIQSSSNNLRGFVGYKFDEFLGAQIDFAGLGSVRSSSGGITKQLFNPDLFSISAVLSKPISDELSMFGKLGGTYWSLRKSGAAQNDPSMNSGFGPSFGVGLDINLYGGRERMLRLEWNYYKMDGVLLNNANSLSLNALFSF